MDYEPKRNSGFSTVRITGGGTRPDARNCVMSATQTEKLIANLKIHFPGLTEQDFENLRAKVSKPTIQIDDEE